jgi:membrane protease YdiL (CAAX protease family)
LHFKPKQGYKYWLVVTAVIGAGLGIVMLLFYGTLSLLGIPTRSVGTPPQLNVFLAWLWQMCVLGPLYEEPIYRLALATGLRAVLPSWAVILIGGVTFAVLHFLYGIADITNALAGFVLTWAFLQSESILVPILLHLLGNIVVVIIWVVSWSLIK